MKTLRRIRFISGALLIGMVVAYTLWLGLSFYIKERITQELLEDHMRVDRLGDIQPSRKGILIKGISATHLHDQYCFFVEECVLTLSFKSLLKKNYDFMYLRHVRIDATTKAALGMISYLLSKGDRPQPVSHGILKRGLLTSKKHKIEGVLHLHHLSPIDASFSGKTPDIDIPFEMTWVNRPQKPYPEFNGSFHIKGPYTLAKGEYSFGEEKFPDSDKKNREQHNVNNITNLARQKHYRPKGFILFKHITLDPSYLARLLNNQDVFDHAPVNTLGVYIQSLRFSLEHEFLNDQNVSLEKNTHNIDVTPLFRGMKFYLDNAYLFDRASMPHNALKDIKRPSPLHTPFFVQGKMNLWTQNPLPPSRQGDTKSTRHPFGRGEIICGDERAPFFLHEEKTGVVWTMDSLTLPLAPFQPCVPMLWLKDSYDVEGDVTLDGRLLIPFQSPLIIPEKDYHQSHLMHALTKDNTQLSHPLSLLQREFLFEKASGDLSIALKKVNLKNVNLSNPKNPQKLDEKKPSHSFSFLKNLSGQFSFTLPSFKITKAQECHVEELGIVIGQPCIFKNLKIQWESHPFFILKRLHGEGMGGSIDLHSFSPIDSGTSFHATLKDISLQALFDHLSLKDIAGEGILEGNAKGVIGNDQSIVITDAKLFSSSPNGSLTYKGLQNLDQHPMTTPTFFTMLTLSLFQKNDQTHVIFDVLGRNQGFQEGVPHRFSIQTKV